MLSKITHKLFLSCKEATYLIELKNNNSINLIKRFRLSIHLCICKICSVYNKKVIALNKILSSDNAEEKIQLDNDEIDSLKEKINSKLKSLK